MTDLITITNEIQAQEIESAILNKKGAFISNSLQFNIERKITPFGVAIVITAEDIIHGDILACLSCEESVFDKYIIPSIKQKVNTYRFTID